MSKASRYEHALDDEQYDRPSSKIGKTSSKPTIDDLEKGTKKDEVEDIELDDKNQQPIDDSSALVKNIVPYFTHPDIIFDWRAVLGEFIGTLLVCI